MQVPLSSPDITQREIDAVVNVMKSGQLALGPEMRGFEQAIAEYSEKKHAISVNSGTSGLYLCMKALGIGPGDEVITTPFTFIATINCIIQAGAKPVMVDIDPVNYNIDPAKIEEKITPATKAIEPVIVFGNPAGIDEVCDIAKKHNLAVIEDSCEALGTVYKGKKAGTFGDAGLYAFYPNKQITTGEGGIIVTDDDKLAELCISMRNQGRGAGGGWLAHERVGYNYRMADINACIGRVQMTRLGEFKEKRKKAAQYYQQILADEKRINVPQEPEGADMSWFVFVIRLADNYGQEHKNALIQMLNERGCGASNYFPPVHLQPFMIADYGYKKGDFPVTEFVSQRTLAIPFFNNLSREQMDYVKKTLSECLDEIDAGLLGSGKAPFPPAQ
ncbi:UDP-4-amino-4-deoxy-L-arabinose--oxoglutarate aminotransferase [Limihaloglobus sulfuriphilus]|uniref:UDP-4-amino-4-deoxy-L-arabinose--oxoglutarate aminotransferase n=1 Tax=Limihaloglobus sulfuriphilus TaxID=1851148 RepID=A0A1Q2MF04_9BACT|nr:DegT/DnrJ/EryC1/StrS family aminotransferase [Limihaloglobus sulfuriphilus]AQQ71283.1 UDP-4-amino-4-deoxy-L-arabinose--oxoglutarate aminotransferase [Limihaloglobus sulfuriphilus]